MGNFIDRVKVLAEANKLNQTNLAEMAGVSRSAIYQAFKKGVTPSVNLAVGIASNVENINTRWLLTGEGEMWIDGEKNKETTVKVKPYPTEQPTTAKTVEPGAAYVSRVQQLENELEWAKQMIAAKDEMLEMKDDKIKMLEDKLCEGEESAKITDKLKKEAM